MENESSILKFVSGIDLSRYKSEDLIASKFQKFEGLRWLKLCNQNWEALPNLKGLKSLEYVSASRNKLKTLDNIDVLNDIAALNFRSNQISTTSVNGSIYFSTSTIDISYNHLAEAPFFLMNAPNLVVLNISHNQIKTIDNILANYEGLRYLDVSHNRIPFIDMETIWRLKNLHVFNAGFNPLDQKVLKSFENMKGLTSLSLSSIGFNEHQVDFSNFPLLQDLDISENKFDTVPPSIFTLKHLIRLNFSNNNIETIPGAISNLTKLKSLICSFNKIRSIPDEIGELVGIVRIYANGNHISSEGIPSSFKSLKKLECLMLAYNDLEYLPPCICHCSALQRLSLRNNRLLTLPPVIYNLKITHLDVKGNDGFSMPKKKKSTSDMYDLMDFSYENVRKMVVTLIEQQLPPSGVVKENKKKEKIVVHKKTRIDKLEEITNVEAKKFKNLNTGTGSIDISNEEINDLDDSVNRSISKKKLDLQHQASIDFSEIFPENVGSSEGVAIFIIDNFNPVYIEENTGTFYSGDCYIVLNNFIENSLPKHEIYFWIGKITSIDKRACAAIHSVNLRNMLVVEDSVSREEEGDESDEFKRLFPFGFEVKEGSSVPSGFFDAKEKMPYTSKMYRIWIHPQKNTVVISSTPLSRDSLDHRFAFMIAEETKIYIWFGKKCKLTLKNKARYSLFFS
ncbi:Protein flightless-1 [Thelohanellus kitauei]|uniref:Protein flightless-1 n=1 Tax=Thelohanellus kitauei TaxID=669202 RepID=A0A0C2NJH7_THEKT|nr:Protein flightless-1 [Thelohanellus kitauei]